MNRYAWFLWVSTIQTILVLVFVISISACNKADEVEFPSKVSKFSKDREVDDDEDEDSCLLIRSGTVANEANREPYRHVGSIGAYDPNVPATAARAKCSATLIRPNIAITSQLGCLTQLNLNNSTDQDQLVFSLDHLDVTKNRAISQIIRWRETEAKFRDTALVVLAEPYGDETFIPYMLRQEEIGAEETFEVSLAGNGVYTDGNDAATYDTSGALRFGTAMLNGIVNANVAQLESPDYDVVNPTDYIRVDSPDGAAISCIGSGSSDLGSPALRLTNKYNWLVGTAGGNNGAAVEADLNDNGNPDDDIVSNANRCAVATVSAYVSMATVGDWIRARLVDVNPLDKVLRRTLVKAKVTEIVKDDKRDQLSLNFIEVYDNGLALEGLNHEVGLCKSGCLPISRISGAVAKDDELLFEIISVDGELSVQSVQSDELARRYDVEFDATILLRDEEPRLNYGRTEKVLRLNYAAPIAGSLPVPIYGETVRALECLEGCSAATTIDTAGLTLDPEVGVHVTGEVIDGQLYLRTIAKNAEFDADKVRERLRKDQGVEGEDSESTQDGKGKARGAGCKK